MPYMSYADWYRQQQQNLLAQNQMRTPGGVQPGQYGYQPISGSQAREQSKEYYTDVGKAAAAGYAKGGETAAIINAAIAAAPHMARSGRQSWDAAKAGNVEGFRRVSTPFGFAGKISQKLEQAGMPTWLSPDRQVVKIVSKLFGGPAPNIEKKRWERLKAYGFDVPKPDWVDTKDAALKAQDKTLANDFVGYNEAGKWVNNRFANSGKDADLKAQDIQEFATNYEVFGDAYGRLPEADRLKIMDIALQNNLVREEKGTVDINWTPETLSQATDILAANEAKNPASQRRVYAPDFGASFKPNF